jgi:hypothetical protein
MGSEITPHQFLTQPSVLSTGRFACQTCIYDVDRECKAMLTPSVSTFCKGKVRSQRYICLSGASERKLKKACNYTEKALEINKEKGLGTQPQRRPHHTYLAA